jgi:hypothetical protein
MYGGILSMSVVAAHKPAAAMADQQKPIHRCGSLYISEAPAGK